MIGRDDTGPEAPGPAADVPSPRPLQIDAEVLAGVDVDLSTDLAALLPLTAQAVTPVIGAAATWFPRWRADRRDGRPDLPSTRRR